MQVRRRQDSIAGSDDSRSHPLRQLAEKIRSLGGERDSYNSEGDRRAFTSSEKSGRRTLWMAKGDANDDPDVVEAEIPSGNEDVEGEEGLIPPNGGIVPDFAQSKAAEEAVADGRQADFTRSLVELRDRGVKIGFTRGVFLTTSGLSGEDRNLMRVLEAIVIKKSRFSFVDEDGAHDNLDDISSSAGMDIIDQAEINPQDVLESQFGNVLLADPDLIDEDARGNRRANVAPYVLDVSKVGGVFYLTATNWVTGKTVLSLELPENDLTVPAFAMTCLQMVKALETDFSRRDLADVVEALPSAQESFRPEDFYLFNDADASAWSVEEENTSRSSWRGLLDRFEVEIAGQPFGTNIDSVLRHVGFDPDQKGRAGSPLNVNGVTEGFVISPKSKKSALAMGSDERMTPYINVESVQDKYGNLIIPVFSEIGKKHKKMVFAGFQVIPPRALAHQGKDGYVPVGVDLTEFGLGDHPLLFKQRVESPAATAEETGTPYAKYSRVEDKDETAQGDVFAKAATEIAKVEAFCGFTPSDVVNAIYLMPSHASNAHTIETNPDTVFIWDEIFPEVLADHGQYVVSHETFHLMDFKFGISENESVKQAFKAMSESYDQTLFPLINEGNYLSFNGGHSAENAAEMVASLLNTVYSGEFEETYSAMDERVTSLYGCLLTSVRDALITGGCPESAPIIAAIDTVLASWPVDAAMPIKNLVVPHMEDLLMPNMEEFETKAEAGTLELADMPVFVLDAFLFKKVVLKSSELSFVYVYHQNEQENVELVRVASLMSAMSGAATFAMPYEQALRYADRFGYQLEGGTIYAFDHGQLIPDLTQPVSIFEELRGAFDAPPEGFSEEEGVLDEDGSIENDFDIEPFLVPEESKGNLDDILISPAP